MAGVVTEILRLFYFVLGVLLVALGLIGIFVPLMPTTIFLILAAWCFARSSTRAEAWLLGHPKLGGPILAWREHKAISRKNKALAITGMSAGIAIFWLGAQPTVWLGVGVSLTMVLCALYVVTRPNA